MGSGKANDNDNVELFGSLRVIVVSRHHSSEQIFVIITTVFFPIPSDYDIFCCFHFIHVASVLRIGPCAARPS